MDKEKFEEFVDDIGDYADEELGPEYTYQILKHHYDVSNEEVGAIYEYICLREASGAEEDLDIDQLYEDFIEQRSRWHIRTIKRFLKSF